MTYAAKLKDPRWQKKRLQIFERDEFTCKLCLDTKTTLHVHHLKYTQDQPFNEPEENLITYCETCHLIVEKFKDEITIKRIVKFQSDQKTYCGFGLKTIDEVLYLGDVDNGVVRKLIVVADLERFYNKMGLLKEA